MLQTSGFLIFSWKPVILDNVLYKTNLRLETIVGENKMREIKDFIEERLEDIVKVLLVILLFLVLMIIIFIYKSGSKSEDSILENDTIEELLLENKKEENKSDENIELINSADAEEINLKENQKNIIDIKGAVESPGVYEMESDSRVIDCIEKAGGFLIEAEQKAVNLAQRTEDQMVIYIPVKGEELSEFDQLLTDTSISEPSTKNNKVDLNKADKEELKSLNGIGDIKAENIISYRETEGYFQKPEDIVNVSGIGEATFEKLKEEIQVTP